MAMIYHIAETCHADAACVQVCPTNAIHPRPDEEGFHCGKPLSIDPNACIGCASCGQVCDKGAAIPMPDSLQPGCG